MSVVGISYLFIYLYVYIYIYIFPPLAVVIECCQWKDGSCKSEPPILMGLDVWYSVVFFCFVLFFSKICWWMLFSWIYRCRSRYFCRLSSLRFVKSVCRKEA